MSENACNVCRQSVCVIKCLMMSADILKCRKTSSLVPTADRRMHVFLARDRVLHYQLFVNGDVEENSPISADRLLQSRVDPTVHVVAWISWAVERGMNHSGKNPSILFVLVPCSYIGGKRCWVKQHAQPCGRWSRWSCYSNCRRRCRSNCSRDCSCNCCRNVG